MVAVILTREEERQLVQTIKRVEQQKKPTLEERRQLQKAKSTLIKLNQFLVAAVVSHYPNRVKSFEALMKAGNIGLAKALKHYDYHKYYKFSTYAIWWIRNEIHKALDLS